jgi:hypothetical protein
MEVAESRWKEVALISHHSIPNFMLVSSITRFIQKYAPICWTTREKLASKLLAVRTSDKHRSIKLCKTITCTWRETDGPGQCYKRFIIEFTPGVAVGFKPDFSYCTTTTVSPQSYALLLLIYTLLFQLSICDPQRSKFWT